MRDLAFHRAAGELAERRAANIRAKLRTHPHSVTERDDAETMAVIYEAAAFDLLLRGPRPTPSTPASDTAAQAKARRRATQVSQPPVEAWRAELRDLQSMSGGRSADSRERVLTRALAAVTEREKVIWQLLDGDDRLGELNHLLSKVADLSEVMA